MVFQPEEIHSTSTVRPRHVGRLIVMDDGSFWFTQDRVAIARFHDDGLLSLTAKCLYPD